MARRKSTTTAAEATKAAEQTQQAQITLIGRLCTDPVLRHTKSGKPVATIRIAVNAPDTEPTFHSVVVWNRTAEVVCEYLRKGRRIEVVGHSQERSYQTADGNDRKVTELVAFRVVFLSGRSSAPAPEQEVA
jgi:single-strand DNA-binding protein